MPKTIKNKKKTPVLITRGIICLPNKALKTLNIGREKSLKAVIAAWNSSSKELLVVSQMKPEMTDPKLGEFYTDGTICKIINFTQNDDHDITIEVRSLQIVKLTNIELNNGYWTALYAVSSINKLSSNEIKAIQNQLKEMLEDYFSKHPNEQKRLSALGITPLIYDDKSIDYLSLNDLIINIASNIDLTFDEALKFISTNNLLIRSNMVCKKLMDPYEEDKIEHDVVKKINQGLSKTQKEFYLRQKLDVIKKELGEISGNEKDIVSFRKRLEQNPYPEYIKNRVNEELNRMESSINSQENSIIHNYVDWLLSLPYWQVTTDNNNISSVEESLNRTHYGLEKVKERIIEYLAVRTKAPNSKSPIICLVGPPGVGKSTLAKSIADALGKKFVQMSLGGVHDEAEIRGHRKTYLGSMPGRIITGMKKAQVANPLFLLDELDKMGNDTIHGDPASALLEVLDPEQNNRFIDNYIEEPYDLSQVLFVATANYAEQIPAPLYDRLEIIELTSYTEKEKLEIAKHYQIPKIMQQTNLINNELTFTDEAISYIINRYTKEAGVRELERIINKITRKFIVKLLHKQIKSQVIGIKEVRAYLDKEIYDYNYSDKQNIPGVVNGMAYTAAGGDLLPIEVTTFKGKGDIIITGNLKETMKESATVALGFVKANADKFGLKDFDFKNHDIHIHVPQGGIPKDGPSAGVTLTTAIISCLANKSVPSNIAMTGEITLRGKVLIIGGIKEKVISAVRGGVNEIFMPIDDERFLKDIPDEIRKKVKFHLVKNYPEIYNEIFKTN